MKLKIVLMIVLLSAFSCKRENQNTISNSDISARLILSRSWFTTFTDTSKLEERYEHAAANFIRENTNKDAGTVRYSDSILHQQLYTHYYLSYKPDDPVGTFKHTFDGNQIWSVSGNDSNKIPTFTTPAPDFPSFLLKNYDSIPIIHKSQPFTISWNSSVPCDSFSIGIYQSNNFVESGIVPGNITSFTFSNTKLSIFELFTPAYIILEGRSYKNIKVSGMPITVETYARRNCNAKIMN